MSAAMLMLLANVIHWFFFVYTLFLMTRVIGSWFPAFSGHPAMRFVTFYTDPYLNLFRRVIPPIGGVLDLSPLLAFFALQMVETILLYLIS
jgi:YggT family protein